MAALHLLGVPPVGVEAERVAPDGRVGVDGVQRGDEHAVGGQTVAAGQDDVGLGGAAGLEGGVVQALGLLDELVEVGHAVGQVGVPGGLVARVGGRVDDAVLLQLLVESVLGALVGDQAVDQPGEQRGGGGEAGAVDDQHVGEDEAAREVLALVVDGAQQVVDDARGLEGGFGHGQVAGGSGGGAGGLDVVDGLLQLGVDGVLDLAQAGRVAPGQVAVPLAAGGDLLVEREEGGGVGDERVERGVDGVEVAKVLAEREVADGLGGELHHELVDVEGLVVGVELVEDGERRARAGLHDRGVVADGARAHGRGQVLVGETPVFRLGVADEDGRVVLDAEEGVAGVDVLGHVCGLGQRDGRDLRAVREVGGLAHVGGFDDGAVFPEEPVVIAQVVGEDLVVAAYEGEAGGALRALDGVAIDAEAHGGGGGCGDDVVEGGERVIFGVEGDA